MMNPSMQKVASADAQACNAAEQDRARRTRLNGPMVSMNVTPLPRLADGTPISPDCPDCGYGLLQPTGNGDWLCDGLAEPENPDRPLVFCNRQVVDGVVVPHKR